MATKYKNPPIWAKFGFQVNYDVANLYSSLVCYGARNWMKFSRIVYRRSTCSYSYILIIEMYDLICFDFWCFITFSNISAISWRPVLVVEEAGVP
jgi:hypothetical protein